MDEVRAFRRGFALAATAMFTALTAQAVIAAFLALGLVMFF